MTNSNGPVLVPLYKGILFQTAVRQRPPMSRAAGIKPMVKVRSIRSLRVLYNKFFDALRIALLLDMPYFVRFVVINF